MGIEPGAIVERFDMTNPFGRAMAQMANVFAELVRAMSANTRADKAVKRGRLERLANFACPRTFCPTPKKNMANCRLTPAGCR
jgi:hypothetical protein